jgi:hypothetical protein
MSTTAATTRVFHTPSTPSTQELTTLVQDMSGVIELLTEDLSEATSPIELISSTPVLVDCQDRGSIQDLVEMLSLGATIYRWEDGYTSWTLYGTPLQISAFYRYWCQKPEWTRLSPTQRVVVSNSVSALSDSLDDASRLVLRTAQRDAIGLVCSPVSWYGHPRYCLAMVGLPHAAHTSVAV